MADLDELKSRVRNGIYSRGARTISGLSRTFRALDSYDGNKKLDREELTVGLRENGIDLTNAEAQALFEFFDRDGSGTVSFDEFIVGIRGELNATRQEVVNQAFNKFDRDGSGYITIDDIRGEYDASFHPKVRDGSMTPDQVFQEFIGNFNDADGDGKVTKAEWDDYYAALSASVDGDDYFVEMMRSAWKL